MKTTKSQYYNEKIDSNKYNSAEMLKTNKSSVSGKNINNITEIYLEDKIEKDEYRMTKKFNNFFIKSIKNIRRKITNQD